ncbi:WbqC family protein [Flavobacteriaceae bacterium]|nr:WbqC family protein [Flavobacteriales bacterium]MBL6877491.1 WbqC family protein [Flavobacteriaceae bacterium]MDA9550998.1 WbqC family protein [Flavobacteriaceae bacterium]MDA9850269.1 WbqC family protein [Flavobacteriaceae bacterium]
MDILIHPNYFPNIHQFTQIIKANNILFEVSDNYQKQTFRNRTYVYGANGKLGLFIPVIHSHKNRELFKDVKISYESNWMDLHLKSLQSAYRSSPYFEYFEDDFIKLYSKKEKFLADFNIKCIKLISNLLDLNLDFKISNEYVEKTNDIIDLRDLSNARKEKKIETPKYIQVFESKHGYINNLSIIDLIFSEGPNSVSLITN